MSTDRSDWQWRVLKAPNEVEGGYGADRAVGYVLAAVAHGVPRRKTAKIVAGLVWCIARVQYGLCKLACWLIERVYNEN